MSDLYWRDTQQFAGSLVHVRGAAGVGFDERAEVLSGDGPARSGQVLATSADEVVVQVFEGTAALRRDGTAVRFLGRVPELVVHEDLLGRVFDGLGRPRDGVPPLLGRRREPLRGWPINPAARAYPREFVQTGVSGIDVLNSLVRGQKLPVFTGSGLPHNRLLAQVVRQARLLDPDAPFALVFVAMGVGHRDARFFEEVFRGEGVLERAALFLNLADDPPVARLAAPRAGLTAAEFLAFERGYHVLAILTDMTHYADALREVSSARDEVPARKGYPGYLYSDLAELYERAGQLKGRGGSVTLLPVVTLPNDDLTHPVPDLTGFITEGQVVLSRDLDAYGVYPPIDVLPSLSRLMKDGIGPGFTRDDHAHLASQLYAAYAAARQVRDLAAVIGEADLSELDRLYLRFGRAFEERFLAQAPDEDRSIAESLDRGWEVLGLLPEDELTRVTVEELKQFSRRPRGGVDERRPEGGG
jgi:V/A-type H+-transporting ATPase subunit B